ncbi:MAG TPA: AMP-binding protein [Burkholderiales bacterium]|nr:AMP-binding protein [Burkholderiales bacterium]
MPEYYDRHETRDPAEREASLMGALPGHIAHAKRNAPGWARILSGVDPAAVRDRKALAALPVTRKSELAALQKAERPFGGLNAAPVESLGRIFVSPGPIYDPGGSGRDWWRTARALFAAGFRRGDTALNTFAYHFTPAGAMLEAGALALGCTVVPAGVGQTETQVATLADLRVSCYIGTPSFLKLIVEKADESGADIGGLKKGSVGAEYLPPALRAGWAERGIRVLQWYGSADLGLIAYESEALEGMILDEGLILEIVRVGTGEPVADGEIGEVVVTSLNPDYPLIRFGTGDLSAVLPGASPCGRTNTRIRGWLGRADQATKVKGMFVHPAQVAEIAKRHAEIVKARLVVDNPGGSDRMTLRCEVRGMPSAGLARAIEDSLRSVTKLRGEVALVRPGELPNDGKVIEDAKSYG